MHYSLGIDADPPQVVPVVGVMVHKQRYPRVGSDVLQSLESSGPFRLLIDSTHQAAVGEQREHDRDQVGPPVGADRAEDSPTSSPQDIGDRFGQDCHVTARLT